MSNRIKYFKLIICIVCIIFISCSRYPTIEKGYGGARYEQTGQLQAYSTLDLVAHAEYLDGITDSFFGILSKTDDGYIIFPNDEDFKYGIQGNAIRLSSFSTNAVIELASTNEYPITSDFIFSLSKLELLIGKHVLIYGTVQSYKGSDNAYLCSLTNFDRIWLSNKEVNYDKIIDALKGDKANEA